MFEKSCACGKSKKNFKVDIGPFFVDECCIEAGYDETGKLVKKELDLTGLPFQDEIEKAAEGLKPDLTPEPEDPVEQAESTEESQEEVKEETKEEKKARLKAEKAAAKKAAKDAEKAKAQEQENK